MGCTSTCFNNYSFISVTLYVDESKEKFRDGSVELCTVTRIYHCEVQEDRICNNSLHPWHSPRVSRVPFY